MLMHEPARQLVEGGLPIAVSTGDTSTKDVDVTNDLPPMILNKEGQPVWVLIPRLIHEQAKKLGLPQPMLDNTWVAAEGKDISIEHDEGLQRYIVRPASMS